MRIVIGFVLGVVAAFGASRVFASILVRRKRFASSEVTGTVPSSRRHEPHDAPAGLMLEQQVDGAVGRNFDVADSTQAGE